MQDIIYKETDVLVIGGGLAGLMAAISAKQKAPSVAIVSKGVVAKSGNTLVAGGWLSSATAEKGNEPEKYYEDVINSGKGLNSPKLVRKLTESSPYMLELLEKYGVKFLKGQEKYVKAKMPGHTVPRSLLTEYAKIHYFNRGLGFTLPLLEKVKEEGICIYEGITIIKLIQADKRIVGAWGIERSGKLWCIRAGSTVLAAGGGGSLYSRTNNTSDITGDSFALALAAGCRLVDMEQIQFYPSMMFQPFKTIISNALFSEGAKLLNSFKEEFMLNYDPAGNMATRDVMSRAIYTEIKAGRGIDGYVYIDCSSIKTEVLQGIHQAFYNNFCEKGLDPQRKLLLVSTCAHFFLGGVKIDETGKTCVPGLYACGEGCGGIHGSNRLAGTALMEACVFGWEAGKTAALETQPFKLESALPKIRVSSINGQTAFYKQRIREEMWNKAAIIRTGRNLDLMLELINEYKKIILKNNSPESINLKNMLKVCETITLSAKMRKESRGAHFREDFPFEQKGKYGNIECFEKNGEIKAESIWG